MSITTKSEPAPVGRGATSGRGAAASLGLDLVSVLALVVIGTRNHDTDTGVGGVLFVAAPFWIAVLVARAVPVVRKFPTGLGAGAVTWVVAVVGGMTLRRFIFDRGTAVAFVIVASIFLGATMLGWRAVATRRRHA